MWPCQVTRRRRTFAEQPICVCFNSSLTLTNFNLLISLMPVRQRRTERRTNALGLLFLSLAMVAALFSHNGPPGKTWQIGRKMTKPGHCDDLLAVMHRTVITPAIF